MPSAAFLVFFPIALLTTSSGNPRPSADWQAYTLGPGIRVELPEKPIFEPIAEEEWQGGIHISRHQKENILVVGHLRLKKGLETPIPRRLSESVEGYLRESGATANSQRDLLINGWHGLEVEFTAKESAGKMRAYAAGDMVYTVAVTGPNANGIGDPATKLFASLKLPDAHGKGPNRQAGPTFEAVKLGSTGASIELPSVPKKTQAPLKGNASGLTMNRLVSEYGNRRYVAVYMDLPEAMAEQVTPDRLQSLFRAMNEDVVRAVGASGATHLPIKIDGEEGLRSLVKADKSVVRVEATYRKGTVFSFIAIVPPALESSDEVNRYFKSVKLPAKASKTSERR